MTRKNKKKGKRTFVEVLLDILIILTAFVFIILLMVYFHEGSFGEPVYKEKYFYEDISYGQYDEVIYRYYEDGYPFAKKGKYKAEEKFLPVADYAREYALYKAYEVAGEGDLDRAAQLREGTAATEMDLSAGAFSSEAGKIQDGLQLRAKEDPDLEDTDQEDTDQEEAE